MFTKTRKLENCRRKPFHCVGVLIIVCLIAFGFAANKASAQTCYRIIDLGKLGYQPNVLDIFGINDVGEAAFAAEVSQKKHAMVYLPVSAHNLTAGITDLHTLAGLHNDAESVAHDINANGIAVGWADVEISPSTFEKHAFVWRLDTDPHQFIDLGTFNDGDWSEAWAINDGVLPIIVGDGGGQGDCDCDPPVGTQDIVRGFWLALTDPPFLLPDAVQLDQAPEAIVGCAQNTVARDVSTAGVLSTAAGYSYYGAPSCSVNGCCGDSRNATVWENPDPLNQVGTALPLLAAGGGSESRGVSDLGAMVGSAYTGGLCGTCQVHAVYWHSDTGPVVDLGTVSGIAPGAQTTAIRMNNNEPPTETIQVAGWEFTSPTTALLWDCAANCDLPRNWSVTEIDSSLIGQCGFSSPDPDWLIRKLFDVNDSGWIVGSGRYTPDNASQRRGFVLVPLENCNPAQCEGDLDGNGTVSTNDLLILFANWGDCPAPPVACFADLDCDGTVNTNDLIILNANWGPCGEAAGGGGSSSLQAAVQQLGFPSVAAHQAWLAQASDDEAYVSTYVLITILQNQE